MDPECRYREQKSETQRQQRMNRSQAWNSDPVKMEDGAWMNDDNKWILRVLWIMNVRSNRTQSRIDRMERKDHSDLTLNAFLQVACVLNDWFLV